MNQIKIGQIGKGSFGEKILSKLKNLDYISIEWVCGSQDKWWEQLNVDWVVIASPNEFHYEQAKYFLEKGINVFCEKPGTLCSNSLQELIKLSKEKNTHFYIDDVLIYEDIKSTNHFIYKKWGGSSANIIDRMAYHHFYLMFDNNNFTPSREIEIIKNDLNHKIFKIIFLDTPCNGYEPKYKEYYFEYDFNWYKERIHTIESQFKGDALQQMLDSVFKENANFKLIHRGYHYPRSLDTIKSCKDNEQSFIKHYNQSILDRDSKHYYSIATDDSLTTAKQYLTVLDKAGLEWKITDTLPNCDLTIETRETFYNPIILKDICHSRIKGNGINLKINTYIKENLKGYKYKVHATYSQLNSLTDEKQDYQFELCEKPLFKLPSRYKNKSLVIMDGPFMCFDPYADTDYHLGGNVVHAIHVRNIGDKPEIPPPYKRYINKGIIKKPKYTNVDRFIESAKKFFPEIEKAKHLGSMYTIRTVLPYKDSTDERPTIVKKQDNNFILFSGKIGNCVEAANRIEELIDKNNIT